MHQDIGELLAFYDGAMDTHVRRLISARIRAAWPNVSGMTVMGLGYATPYLSPFRKEAYRLGALMPAEQGARAWPSDGVLRTIAVEEDMLPLPDASVDRFLAVHAIEMSDGVKRTLREIWRVLKPEGRALIIVPNRRSIWARREITPFGQGQPFSRSQLEQLISGGMFAVESCSYALATPPIELRLAWRYAPTLERVGLKVWPAFAGVIILEATKQVSASLPKGRLQAVGGRLRPVAAVSGQRQRPGYWRQGLSTAANAPGQQEHSLIADQVLQDVRNAKANPLAVAVEGHAPLDACIDEIAQRNEIAD